MYCFLAEQSRFESLVSNSNGRPRPWAPEHLGFVMEQHKLNGPRYTKPGFHSGYNEVVLSTDAWDAPAVIRAFFIVEGCSSRQEAATRRIHRQFLQEFPSRSEEDTPLLRLRPLDWERPFEVVDNSKEGLSLT